MTVSQKSEKDRCLQSTQLHVIVKSDVRQDANVRKMMYLAQCSVNVETKCAIMINLNKRYFL